MNKLFKILIISLIVFGFALATNAGINFDLANLRNKNSIFTKAYDIIKIQNSWEKIQSLNPSLSAVKIGIIDSGVDASHPEFAGELVNSTVIGAIDFGNTPASAKKDSEPTGHGTQVAGIIGANNISGLGITLPTDSPQMNGIVSGALSQSKYSLEVRKNPSLAFLFDELNAIFLQSKLSNADIVNLSLGLVKRSALTEEQQNSGLISGQVNSIHFSITTQIYRLPFNSAPSTLFVVAAGNENVDATNETPANLSDLPNVLTIGASNLDDKRATFNSLQESNFGNVVDISAPGENVYASKPGNEYDKPVEINGVIKGGFSGTSAAAPMVTGVAGLIKAIRPELTPAQIKEILISTADPIQTGEPSKRIGTGCYSNPNDPVNTGCRLNALKAVCDSRVLNCVPTPPPQPSNTWSLTGSLNSPRASHTAVVLNDGRVLITGGFNGASGPNLNVFSSAEIYNPATGVFTGIANMSSPRAFHTATLLPNGKVLIVGGTSNGNAVLNSAEIFDPNTNMFSPAGNLNQGRYFHSATLMSNGKVLIAGGQPFIVQKSTEIFDPATNSFAPGLDMNESRANHSDVLLSDGRVLLINGLATIPGLNSMEIFNSQSNAFSLISSTTTLGTTANLLPNNKVLIAGSKLLNQGAGFGAEIFDPGNNSLTEVGPMPIPSLIAKAVLLNNNKTLLILENRALLFDFLNNTFQIDGNLNTVRGGRFTANLLRDGRVLVVGGQTLTSFIATSTAEMYQP